MTRKLKRLDSGQTSIVFSFSRGDAAVMGLVLAVPAKPETIPKFLSFYNNQISLCMPSLGEAKTLNRPGPKMSKNFETLSAKRTVFTIAPHKSIPTIS
mmetsp:Transcript_10594/g.22196  ORF Transcript_10594/g.22196 Transcript_10594/m.22196 type:complete len:98 (+) Transcript_10594:179-472(+)